MKCVSYIRVSTKRQGESGLGLEAQQNAVANYVASAKGEVVREFREVETGKRSDRLELAKAIDYAKKTKSLLVVGKLDRLARNVAFTSALMESGVEFVACDNPHANRLLIHILAAIAEDEARRISERTKDALAAAKRRGTKLGSSRPGHWEGREHLRDKALKLAVKAAAVSHRKETDKAYEPILEDLRQWRREGLSTRQIAAKLNEEGHVTRTGCKWNAGQVSRVLNRFAQ